jgi:cell division septation protein DedD
MPNPSGNSLYRIQVGAFSNTNFAQQCFNRLVSAGFTPYYEQSGNMYRVVIVGIKPAEMTLVVQRLASAGFTDIWIREER